MIIVKNESNGIIITPEKVTKDFVAGRDPIELSTVDYFRSKKVEVDMDNIGLTRIQVPSTLPNLTFFCFYQFANTYKGVCYSSNAASVAEYGEIVPETNDVRARTKPQFVDLGEGWYVYHLEFD